ncbi:MAG: ATP-binding protein [Christensenellales bacterium]|jgi:two-component system OmpR family sensor kinase
MRNRFLDLYYSIKSRIIIPYVIVIGLLMAFFNIAILNLMEQQLVDNEIARRRAMIEVTAIDAVQMLQRADAQALHDYVTLKSEELGGRLIILDQYGVVQADPFSILNGIRLSHREVQDVLIDKDIFSHGFHQDEPQEERGTRAWLMYSVSPVFYNGSRIGAVLLSSSVQPIVTSVDNLNRQMRVNSLGIVTLVAIISYFVATLLVNPLEEMTDNIETMSREHFNRSIPLQTGNQTEMIRLGSAFNAMTENLQSIEQARNEFVSNASHELKTPLSSMKILTEALLHQQPYDPDLTHEFLSDINREIDRLNTLVTDLLLLAQMDKQGSAFDFRVVQLDDLLVATVKALVPLAKSRNITMLSDIESPAKIMGEEVRLQQMLTNLVDNAIKYTPEGGRVRVEMTADEDTVSISVIDNGYGIPPEALDKLFERFFRIDRARTRDTGGTGLGLAIVKQILQMHNGTIHVQSHEGQGSIFTVTLPRVPEEVPSLESSGVFSPALIAASEPALIPEPAVPQDPPSEHDPPQDPER